jgi:hypothetical protein
MSPAHRQLPTISIFCGLCLRIFSNLLLHRHNQLSNSWEPTLLRTTETVSWQMASPGSLSSDEQLWNMSTQLHKGFWASLSPTCHTITCSLTQMAWGFLLHCLTLPLLLSLLLSELPSELHHLAQVLTSGPVFRRPKLRMPTEICNLGHMASKESKLTKVRIYHFGQRWS